MSSAPQAGPGSKSGSQSSQASQMQLRSKLGGPIAQLDFLDASLLMAELSRAAYFGDIETTPAFRAAGFEEIEFFDRDGAQAYILNTRHDCVVICRGTEPTEWNDVKADINVVSVLEYTIGRVHSGFKREVDDLWPRLEKALAENKKPVWFTGHSLGGAMATICAGRCKISTIPSNPAGLITFGSPRVGDKRYINFVRVKQFRWVNNNDIVARVPPRWMGYRHSGREIYIDSTGNIQRLRPLLRVRDRWKGFLKGIVKMRVDHLSDHPMGGYIAGIEHALEVEKQDKPLEVLQIPRQEWRMPV